MATLTTQDETKVFYTVRGEGRPPFIFIPTVGVRT
jgi:hypothetical protein